MVDRRLDCDPNRLRRFLEETPEEDDRAAVAAHLDRLRVLPRSARGDGGRGALVGRAAAIRPGPAPGPMLPFPRPRGRYPGRPARIPRSARRRRVPRPVRSLPGDRGRRPGRDGRGAQGVRPGTAPGRGHQGDGPAARRRGRRAATVHPRGAGGRLDRARSRRHHPRRRRVEGPALHRDVLRRRPIAPGAARPVGPHGPARDREGRDAGRLRACRGACPGAGAPRHQALEHPAGERRGAGEDHRLRPGPLRRRREPDAGGRCLRHARSTCRPSRLEASRWITGPTCSASAA